MKDPDDRRKRIVNISGIKHVSSLWAVKYDKKSASTELPETSVVKEVEFIRELTGDELLYKESLSENGSGFIRAFGGEILADFSSIYKNVLSWRGVYEPGIDPIDESFYENIGYGAIQLLF